MRQSKLNRWWTFALAIVVLAWSVALPAVALADWSSNGGVMGDGTPGGAQTPGVPQPQGAGDPDSPSTSGKWGNKPSFGAGRPGAGIYGAQGAGSTAAASRGLWLLKVRIAMETFRIFTLRF